MLNYTNLVLAIGNYLGRTDLAEQIPLFIELAEARIYYGSDDSTYPSPPLRIRAMQQSARQLVYGKYGKDFYMPNNFLAPRSWSFASASDTNYEIFSNHTLLETISPERAYGLAGQSGPPRFVSFFNGQLQLLPTPSEAGYVILDYYGKFPPLSDKLPRNLRINNYGEIDLLIDDPSSNWLLNNAAGVYLYGALLEAESYMLHDERIPVWAAMFKSLLSALNNSEATSLYTPNAMLSRRDDMLRSAP